MLNAFEVNIMGKDNKNQQLQDILDEYKNIEKKELSPNEFDTLLENVEKYESPNRTSPHALEIEQGKKEEMAKQMKTRKRTRLNIIAVVIIILITAVVVFAGFKIFSDITGFGQKDNLVEVTIEEGSNSFQIASILEEEGIVENANIFRLYAKKQGFAEKLNFGNFQLNSNMSYDKIIEVLLQPAVRHDIVTINFFEGMTQKEIGERLEEKGVCTSAEFRDALNNHSYDYKFLNEIKPNPDKFNKYEGYLFPDTYQFYLNEDPKDVVNRFFTNFEKRVTESIRDAAKEKGMTLDEVITLASIVQAEAGDPANMYDVAGVFLNRLNSNTMQNLESDVTIFYVREDIKPYLENPEDEDELDVWYDVYSTYLCKGLPAGPIGNPGLDAIDAVLNPAEHDYYFFVTDLKGKYYYAKTANEHYSNVGQADRVNATLKNSEN